MLTAKEKELAKKANYFNRMDDYDIGFSVVEDIAKWLRFGSEADYLSAL